MLQKYISRVISRAENRLGVPLDYVRRIAAADLRLLARYNRIFGFLDPNRHLPPAAYHAARLRGALSADCGTCVEAEVNLALAAGLNRGQIAAILQDTSPLPPDLAAVVRLADAVAGRREDDPEARAEILTAYGEAGLAEIAFAMNGAALLPGIKRALGHATACDLTFIRRMRNNG